MTRWLLHLGMFTLSIYLSSHHYLTAFSFSLLSCNLPNTPLLSRTSPILGFYPSVLTAEQYSFQVTVNYTSSSVNRSLVGSVQLRLNKPPSRGVIQVEPATGFVRTLFTVTTSAWFDSDGITGYQFAFLLNPILTGNRNIPIDSVRQLNASSGEVEIALTPIIPEAILSNVVFPPGNITVVVYAYDRLGVSSRYFKDLYR